MLGYVTLGTADLFRAAAFYDSLTAALGAGRIMDNDKFIAWGPADGGPGLSVGSPEDGRAPHPGNGVMVALMAEGRPEVDQVHALALGLGAAEILPPSERFTGYYAGDFRDLDGNHLSIFTIG